MSEEVRIVECAFCGRKVQEDEGHHDSAGVFACDNCLESGDVKVCTCCGRFLLADEAIYTVDDDAYCPRCAQSELVRCDWCDARVRRDDTYVDRNGMHLCRDCYDRAYVCEYCGRFIDENEAYWIDGCACCESCYEEHTSNGIHNYSYKPKPHFHWCKHEKQPFLYLGVELEIDKGGEDIDNASTFVDIMGGENYLYCKSDGSLKDGIELVSHPCTLEYHEKEMAWEGLLDEARKLGYRSHDTMTCGLHVHVNRKFLGNNELEEERTLLKLLLIVERLWPYIVVFSRRTQEQLEQWAKKYLSKIDAATEDELKTVIKDNKNRIVNRYYAVNLTNKQTVEFRVFRGTLRYETFMATLEFVDFLVRIAKKLTVKQAWRLNWKKICHKIAKSDYKYLKDYIIYCGIWEEV